MWDPAAVRRHAPHAALTLLVWLAAAVPASADDLTVTAQRTVSPRQTEFTMATAAFDFPAAVRVLLPDGYAENPRRRYPVLYLFHGSFDTAASWTDKGDVEAITTGAPMIVVMPQAAGKGNAGGWASDWLNEGREGPPRFETFTIGQLVPWVDAHYRTRARRSGRAIAGLSMGGFTAMSYAGRHPDLFAAAASFSGAVDTNDGEVQPVIGLEALADGGATPDAIWGPRLTSEIVWRAHNPWDLADNLRGMTLSIRTGNGQPPPDQPGPYDPIEGGVHTMSVSLHSRLDELGIAHVFEDYGPGTHTWPFWQQDLRRELPLILGTFERPPPDVPKPFTYRSAEPVFSVYGWRVTMRRNEAGFASLTGAGRRGFTLTGGAALVRTARIVRPRSVHLVRVGTAPPRRVRAGRLGRLRIETVADAKVSIR